MNTTESVKHLFLDLDTGWVLWFLTLLSVASVAIALERFLYYRRRSGLLSALAETVHARLSRGDRAGAIQALSASPAVAASIACAGLQLAHLGQTAAEKAMQSRLAFDRDLLERRLSFLGTLGNNAPFIGLFGTVIGVIHAFEELGHGAAGHGDGAAGAAGQVASAAVMSAIAEALVATAVGIAVALPAVAAYNYLQRRVSALLSGSEVLSNLVLAYLYGPAPEAEGGAE